MRSGGSGDAMGAHCVDPVAARCVDAVVARCVDAVASGSRELADISPVLAETLSAWVGTTGSPLLLLRTQRPYLLLGPRDTRLPRLADALEWARETGLPVFERISGGAAVLLDEDCLSFAVMEPCRDMSAIQRNYRRLTAGVVDALASLGLEVEFGEAEGSYCPGPYDLVAGGVKVAGVSQALRRGVAYVGGMILVRQPPDRAVDTLESFYRYGGEPRRFNRSAVTSLTALLGKQVTMDDVAAALRAAYGGRLALRTEPLNEPELRRARELLTRRRLD